MKFRIVKDLYESLKGKFSCLECSDIFIIQRELESGEWESIEWCNSLDAAKSLIKFYDKSLADQYEVLYEMDVPANQVRKIFD